MSDHRAMRRAVDRIRFSGRQPCCGATNAPCPRPPGIVYETPTGCNKCGHSKPCHAYWWSARDA